MRHPAEGATGGWVISGLVYKWLPLWEFSLFDTPWGYEFSGNLGSQSHHSHCKGSDLISGWEQRFHRWLVMSLSRILKNTPKQEAKDAPRQMTITKPGK